MWSAAQAHTPTLVVSLLGVWPVTAAITRLPSAPHEYYQLSCLWALAQAVSLALGMLFPTLSMAHVASE